MVSMATSRLHFVSGYFSRVDLSSLDCQNQTGKDKKSDATIGHADLVWDGC
jgi:hypothetical protein